MAKNPERKIGDLKTLTEEEEDFLLCRWKGANASYGSFRGVHELFEERVEASAEAVAVVQQGRTVSYGELNAMANRLGHYLRDLGVGPETRVGICLERSVEMVAGLLAILKAGGAYVPLDPEYPVDRLRYMLEDAAAPVVLTESRWVELLSGYEGRLVLLDTEQEQIRRHSAAGLGVPVVPDQAVYVIYTSGSTGRPKGVVNTHDGVSNRLLWMQEAYGLGGEDRVLQKTTFSFDVSAWEFFWPLLSGAALVLAQPGGQRDSAYLVELIAEQRVTVMHFVPSMLRVFLNEADLERCTSLREVMCSGEALSGDLVAQFRRRCQQARLHNLYGPTEAAVDVTFWECGRAEEEAVVPIGRPIANIQIYVLDGEMKPVPIGVVGELYIGGVGVARGYLNRPALTAERFLPDPFAANGMRLYCTGDRARWRSDGVLEYLGRNDDQVKIRGYRIELGEIEAVLREQVGVRDAAVMVREDTPGQKRLVAYVVGEAEVTALRNRLGQRLPDYMVPAAFIPLEKLPLTVNGKLDRKALPLPGNNGEELEAPDNDLEQSLIQIWGSLLDCATVNVTANYFDLGGDSLRLIAMQQRIATELNVHLPITDLFRYPTVRSLCRHLLSVSDRTPATSTRNDFIQLDPERIIRLRSKRQSSPR